MKFQAPLFDGKRKKMNFSHMGVVYVCSKDCIREYTIIYLAYQDSKSS